MSAPSWLTETCHYTILTLTCPLASATRLVARTCDSVSLVRLELGAQTCVFNMVSGFPGYEIEGFKLHAKQSLAFRDLCSTATAPHAVNPG